MRSHARGDARVEQCVIDAREGVPEALLLPPAFERFRNRVGAVNVPSGRADV